MSVTARWLAGSIVSVLLECGIAAWATTSWTNWPGPERLAGGAWNGREFLSQDRRAQVSYVIGVYDTILALQVDASSALRFGRAFSDLKTSIAAPDKATDLFDRLEKMMHSEKGREMENIEFLREGGLMLPVLAYAKAEGLNEEDSKRLFVLTLAAGRIAAGLSLAGASKAFSIPKDVTMGQLTDIVHKYVRDHPEEQHLSAAAMSWNAIATAFHGGSKERGH